jgi:hypothetical protein
MHNWEWAEVCLVTSNKFCKKKKTHLTEARVACPGVGGQAGQCRFDVCTTHGGGWGNLRISTTGSPGRVGSAGKPNIESAGIRG